MNLLQASPKLDQDMTYEVVIIGGGVARALIEGREHPLARLFSVRHVGD